MRVRAAKLAMASKKNCPYKMGRALLPEFFTPDELKKCSTVQQRAGQIPRPQADHVKLQCVLGMYCAL